MCSQLKNVYICMYVQENVSLCTYKVQIKKNPLLQTFSTDLMQKKKRKKI